MTFPLLEAIEHSPDAALRLIARTAGDRDVERRAVPDRVWGRRFAACSLLASHAVWAEGQIAIGSEHAVRFGAYSDVIDENLPYDGHRGVLFVLAPPNGAPQIAPLRLLIDAAPFEHGRANGSPRRAGFGTSAGLERT